MGQLVGQVLDEHKRRELAVHRTVRNPPWKPEPTWLTMAIRCPKTCPKPRARRTPSSGHSSEIVALWSWRWCKSKQFLEDGSIRRISPPCERHNFANFRGRRFVPHVFELGFVLCTNKCSTKACLEILLYEK